MIDWIRSSEMTKTMIVQCFFFLVSTRPVCFYSESTFRNRCVGARRLTWQMAGERRSSRLCLAVRWSVPVPIVSPRLCPPKTTLVTARTELDPARVAFLPVPFGHLSPLNTTSRTWSLLLWPVHRKNVDTLLSACFPSLINVAVEEKKERRKKETHSPNRKSEQRIKRLTGLTNRPVVVVLMMVMMMKTWTGGLISS